MKLGGCENIFTFPMIFFFSKNCAFVSWSLVIYSINKYKISARCNIRKYPTPTTALQDITVQHEMVKILKSLLYFLEYIMALQSFRSPKWFYYSWLLYNETHGENKARQGNCRLVLCSHTKFWMRNFSTQLWCSQSSRHRITIDLFYFNCLFVLKLGIYSKIVVDDEDVLSNIRPTIGHNDARSVKMAGQCHWTHTYIVWFFEESNFRSIIMDCDTQTPNITMPYIYIYWSTESPANHICHSQWYIYIRGLNSVIGTVPYCSEWQCVCDCGGVINEMIIPFRCGRNIMSN